ncbi:MAG: amidotransferase [Bacteroidota bacterium]
MKAGLFECDHTNEAVREKYGDYSDMFVQLFPELDWTFYDVANGEFPPDLNACDVYFATGSRRSVYEAKEWIDRVKQTIRAIATMDKCFVGFCFGHQLLGEAMGGKVQKSPNGWCVGVHSFAVETKASWMQPFQQPLNLLMMCQDQVLELPDNAKVWASSTKIPVGIFQVGEKMLGIQAHPEFSKAYDKYLIELRRNKLGDAVADHGIKSLDQDIQHSIIRNWVLNFIGYQG